VVRPSKSSKQLDIRTREHRSRGGIATRSSGSIECTTLGLPTVAMSRRPLESRVHSALLECSSLRSSLQDYLAATPGLLDHLLKHMVGPPDRVPEGFTYRFQRRHNADGATAMEYWPSLLIYGRRPVFLSILGAAAWMEARR
jgi:hypothetical protein